MTLSLIPWVMSGFLMYSSVSLAVSAWKREGRLSRRSGMSLLVGMLETAAVAGLFRLVVPWSPGTVALWVAAAVALAAAVAGVIIRWPELSARSQRTDPGTADPVADPAGTAAAVADPGAEKPGRTKARKKPKKEPGRAAVAGNAGVLVAVVAVSFAIG